MADKGQAKKDFNRTRASVAVLPLTQRLMLNSTSGRIHPHGRYKVFDCITCTVAEKDLPFHWKECEVFRDALRELTTEAPDAYIDELNKPDNNILLRPKAEQEKMLRHYEALGKAIQNLEELRAWFTRDHVYSTERAKRKDAADIGQGMEID